MRRICLAVFLALAAGFAAAGEKPAADKPAAKEATADTASGKPPAVDYGWQGEARELNRARSARFGPVQEKYRVLMLLDKSLADQSVGVEGAQAAMVATLESHIPDFLADCAAAGITGETAATALWQLRSLWRDARHRLASAGQGAANRPWEPLSELSTNHALRDRVFALFDADRAAGVPLVAAHSHGLVHVVVNERTSNRRLEGVTVEMAAMYLMGRPGALSADIGAFHRLRDAAPGLAYAGLAATFAVSSVEDLLGRPSGDTPLSLYLDGLATDDVTLADALATLDALEARVAVARAEFAHRNREAHVEFCDRWLNRNFGRLRNALMAVYGE